jgi:hypothetical protein
VHFSAFQHFCERIIQIRENLDAEMKNWLQIEREMSQKLEEERQKRRERRQIFQSNSGEDNDDGSNELSPSMVNPFGSDFPRPPHGICQCHWDAGQCPPGQPGPPGIFYTFIYMSQSILPISAFPD